MLCVFCISVFRHCGASEFKNTKHKTNWRKITTQREPLDCLSQSFHLIQTLGFCLQENGLSSEHNKIPLQCTQSSSQTFHFIGLIWKYMKGYTVKIPSTCV